MTSVGSNFLYGRPHGADPSPIRMPPPESDPPPLRVRHKWMALSIQVKPQTQYPCSVLSDHGSVVLFKANNSQTFYLHSIHTKWLTHMKHVGGISALF